MSKEVAEVVEEEAAPIEGTEATAETTADEGAFTQSFLDNLPDDFGKHSVWGKYKNVEEMAKGTINAQSLTSKKVEEFWNSEDEEIVALRRKTMGVPDEVSGYPEYDAGEFPEDKRAFAIERADAFKQFAHEKGYSAQQVADILEFDKQAGLQAITEAESAQGRAQEEAEKVLRAEWKGDSFAHNVEKIKNHLTHLGLESWITDPAFGNNPERMKEFLNVIVPLTSDDRIIGDKQSQSLNTVQDSLVDIEGRMSRWEGSTNSPEYKALGEQRMKLLMKMK